MSAKKWSSIGIAYQWLRHLALTGQISDRSCFSWLDQWLVLP